MSTRRLAKRIAISFVVLCALAGFVTELQAQTTAPDVLGIIDLRFWLDQKGRFSKTESIDVRRAQVRAIADSFAQLHGGKVGFIYETALFGFSIELSNETAAIEISRSPQVKFVEQDAIGTFGASIKNH